MRVARFRSEPTTVQQSAAGGIRTLMGRRLRSLRSRVLNPVRLPVTPPLQSQGHGIRTRVTTLRGWRPGLLDEPLMVRLGERDSPLAALQWPPCAYTIAR